MKYWLTTDTHFGHDKMEEYCGRPKDFARQIKDNLIKVIRPDDVLVHLGDFCIGNDEKWHNEFMEAVICKKWLVKGNHDRKSNTWYLNHGWQMVCDQFRDNYFGKLVMFSHIPVVWDGYYDVNIHGHFHNSDHRRQEPELLKIKNGYQKLLALEYTNYKPVLLDDFLKTK